MSHGKAGSSHNFFETIIVIIVTNTFFVSNQNHTADSGMEGVLPPEISLLSELTKIDFSDNEIVGSIPLSWTGLTQLGKLNKAASLL